MLIRHYTLYLGFSKWCDGDAFCSTSGKSWEYQESNYLLQKLHKGIERNYTARLTGSTDKSSHSLFLIASGPGTGKSRLLDEFKQLVVKVSCQNSALKEMLEGAYVFKINLENGTRYSPGDENMDNIIGSRMLFQLCSPSSTHDFGTLVGNIKAQRIPSSTLDLYSILTRVAVVEKKNIEDMTFIFLVDGIQNLPHTPGAKDSVMYSILTKLGNILNSSGKKKERPFVIVCIAATVEIPIQKWLNVSMQDRINLIPPKLDGKKVINTKDELEELLVHDMGGHGRLLEVLSDVLRRHPEASLYDLSAKVICDITRQYQTWTYNDTGAKNVLIAVLTGKKYATRDCMVSIDDFKVSIEDIEQTGMITWNGETKQLECPFVWMHIRVPELLELFYADSNYSQVLHNSDPEKYPLGVGCWQSWEDFTARFWCFKTSLFAGQTIGWYNLHSGAMFNKIAPEPSVKVKKLTLVKAKNHCSTTTIPNTVTTETGTVKPQSCDVHILCASGNPAADSFSCIEEVQLDGTVCTVTFAVSCKNKQANASLAKYEQEWLKAASTCDFFMEYGTGKYSIAAEELPNNRCGLVSKENFAQYFGPFAGRAFSLHRPFPNVNTARRSRLQAVDGIGAALCENIITERTRQRIADADDLECRIPKLKRFSHLFHY